MFLSLDLTMPSLLARSLYTHNMCPLFAYAGYAAVRAPVEAKKKRDVSSFNTYTVFCSLGMIFNFFKIPPFPPKQMEGGGLKKNWM